MIAKRYIYTIFAFLFLFCGCKRSEQELLLIRVDNAIKNSENFQKKAFHNAENLAAEAEKEPNKDKKLLLLLKSAEAYKNLDLQKSLDILLKAQKLVCKSGNNRTDSIKIILQLASIYNAQGLMLKEATDLYDSLPRDRVPQDLLADYYIVGVQINHNLSQRAFNPAMKETYGKITSSLRDSVLKFNPDNIFISTNKLREQGKTEEAIQLMLKNPPGKGDRVGPYYHHLARLYCHREKPDSQIYYLALAAADDLENGIREYRALSDLAQLLASSNLSRSLTYITQSRKDARESNSALRASQVGPVYSHISGAYYAKQKQWLTAEVIVSSALLIILVLIAFGVQALRKKNRELSVQSEQLKIAYAETDKANSELAHTNSLLAEESRLKEYYIRSFMKLCLSFLSKMEGYRAKIGKIASGGDIKKIMDTINSSRFMNQEAAEFYHEFDRAFLSLYPDFISILNSLLKEESRYSVNGKFVTELRIYALIWLGFESSGDIAKFLRCSESTVYNYRTQMRNKAIDRGTFEDVFIEISHQRRHKIST